MNRNYDKKIFDEEIRKIKNKYPNNIRVCDEIVMYCRKYLRELREQVIVQGFLNESDEIHFFKEIKKTPLSQLIYYMECRDIEVNFYILDVSQRKKFLKKHLKMLKYFLGKHTDFVKYIRLKHTYLDKQFFTRKFCDIEQANQSYYIPDRLFNTSHDRLLAKLTAFQNLITDIQEGNLKQDDNLKDSSLKWTSSKISLTELVYALYHSKVINHGRADIKQIACALQNTFNFNLDDIYHTFSEIRSRKKERVKFLDELAYNLTSRIDSLDN